jgi:hypothetical protein
MTMEVQPNPAVPADELRARYRCTMCHKHCRIPCRLTAVEFQQLQDGTFEGTPPTEPIDWS